MKLEDTLYQAPELSEEKFGERLEELIKQFSSYRVPLLSIKKWTAKELIKEWELVQNKQSNLTRSQRDDVKGIVSMALLNMFKEESDDSNG